MNRIIRSFCVIWLSFSSFAMAQNLGTGLYGFGSFDSRGFDTVNLGNLNVHATIPIFHKTGRGVPFGYDLTYDSLVWTPVGVGGAQTWQPVQNFGWLAQTVVMTGYVSYATHRNICDWPPPKHGDFFVYDTFVYHDAFGVSHSFSGQLEYDPTGCDTTTTSFTSQSSDGSGLSLTATGSGTPHATQTITTADRRTMVVPTGPASAGSSITDSNGNQVSVSAGGVYTDTLGTPALTVSGGGTAASPVTLTYPVTLQADSATTATATIYYKTYTVQTHFQCGIGEYGANPIDLVDHITLADGSSTYSFTYEITPGFPSSVTGRLASVTLPTGGTINYSYTYGCNGSGINADGTVGSLTRTTSDGSRSYGRSPVSGPGNATSTTVTDEKTNQTFYAFSSVNGFFYETNRAVYQGAVGGPQLLGTFTCYNGAQPDCTGGVVTPPFTQSTVVRSYNTDIQDSVVNIYDASGMLTSSTQGQSGQPPMVSQTNSYSPQEWLLQSATLDSSGVTVVAQTNYYYDEIAATTTSGIPQHNVITTGPGNQTSTSTYVGGGISNITTSTAYWDTGAPISTATPNGTTHFGYDPTQTFATLTTLPTTSSGLSLATSATYDPPSGVLLSTTGMNSGQTTQVTQYDRLLRPTIVSLPNGSQITYNYESTNQTGVLQSMGNGQSTHTETLYDAYGRTSRVAVYNGQPSPYWYQVDYCYDATGLLQFQTTAYQANGFANPKQCSGSGATFAYDAMGRMTSSTNADGTAYHQYYGRAVKTTDVSGVQKITQYDLLGRVSAVCEVSSSPLQGDSPQDCQLEIAGSGYLTKYTYDLANHKTTITQGAQTRVFQTDAAGRTIQTIEPERGTTTYSYLYNGTGLHVTRTRPRANQTNPATTTTTTTQYDSLGRVLSISYDDGTPARNFGYDTGFNWAILPNQTNVKGMLSEAWTGLGPSNSWSATVSSYDSMGRVTGMAECLPFWCGNSPLDKRLDFNYDLTGNLNTATDGAGVTTTYSYTPAGEVQQITSSMNDATHPATLVSNMQNGPNGPITYSLGNGVNVARTYDGLGRLNGWWFCYGSNQPYCPGGTQQYAGVVAWQGSRATADSDTALGQGHWYGYDEFNRLTSSTVNTGPVQNFTYAYDRYGNRWQQNALQGGPAPQYNFDVVHNQISGSGIVYDAAGNIANDGFHSYTYDAEGNIVQVDGGATATYYYNALNQRVRADAGGTSRDYLYNASGQRASVWDGNTQAQIQGQYYWGSTPIAFYSGGSLHFQHQDGLGTERARTAYNGSVEGSYTSLPFGDGFSASGADNDPYHFAQLDHDTESWTEHAQFRNYSSTQGRWLSPDPYDGSYDSSNPQSLNRYAYVQNNPLGMIDPFGLTPVCLGVADTTVSTETTTTAEDGTTSTTVDVTVTQGSSECWDNGSLTTVVASQPLPSRPNVPPIERAPNNGRNCSPSPASAGQYAISSAAVAGMTAEFFSGIGAQDRTFGADSSVSAVMGQSGGVQSVLDNYYMTGKTSGLYSFGGVGYATAGANPVAQFVGSFRYSISPGSGGINLSLTNTTSFRSLTYDIGPQWGRHTQYPGAGVPMGNTHQTYNIFVPCKVG